MNSEDEHVVSDTFDLSNLVDTELFQFNSDPSKASSYSHHTSTDYLRVTIGEPLSRALAYVIIYQPEDAIEFIANFLIDWSRQKLLEQETNSMLMSIEISREQTRISERHKIELHRLSIERQEKQRGQLVFEYDKHVLTSYPCDFDIDPCTDDEREPSNHFHEQKQEITRTNTPQYIHTHDTASGINDDMENHQENNETRICHDGNRSSFTYFSQLKDKIIKCY